MPKRKFKQSFRVPCYTVEIIVRSRSLDIKAIQQLSQVLVTAVNATDASLIQVGSSVSSEVNFEARKTAIMTVFESPSTEG